MLYINNRFNNERKNIELEKYVPEHVVNLKDFLSQVYYAESGLKKPEKFDNNGNSLYI